MSSPIDHRQLADEMEIYFLNESVGAGLPNWLPHGVAIRDSLEAFVKDLEFKGGYQRVISPHLAKADLYQASGHLRAFKEDMYPPIQWPEDQSQYYLKPMNCPHHHMAFAALPRSYRDLPLRLAEYGQVYRFERSGSLKGLSRVRGLCQNDGHIYMPRSKSLDEVISVLELHERCYRALGLKGYRYRLSKHDPHQMQKFDGEVSLWQESEKILKEALDKLNLEYFEAEGEAAFYGPKIDVQMKMNSGIEESIASVQLDFNSGKKFNLQFINQDGKSEHPWIVHRAPLGSHERFVALLLEFYQGRLPGWLAPIQVHLIPVREEHIENARQLAQELRMQGVRAQVEMSQGSVSKKLLFSHRLRPFSYLVIGDKEIKEGVYNLQRSNMSELMGLQEMIFRLKELLKQP
ncbi:hypothetical protein AZI86_13170 [Bdellovibrio bacteriovorus]|uniref:Threonine--tRNA ligase n=1 Tax=Bdellovibrio bacteriovorus TaxID=959 RepID=A0A150WJ98_BDEBC|nr:threonine--tRNA ligase [Bdellovibrio bacteriovorus]KYG63770.1 hypothetical protein AZI86_13170 [Bdellovibrio bacteriovorus]